MIEEKEEKELAVSENAVNSILKPLNMHLRHWDGGLRIETSLYTGCMFKKASGWCSYAETHLPGRAGLDNILGIISKSTLWIADSYSQLHGWKNVENPYFGCKTLEEMLIRKDLLEHA